MTIRILIVDDHPLYREGVARVLAEADDIEIVAEAGDVEEAVAEARRTAPDLVLLDVSMPGGGGIAALGRLRELEPAPIVAMLTVSEEDDDILRSLKKGALGYVLKGIGGRDLVRVVRDLAAGRSYVSPSLAARILDAMREDRARAEPLESLTRREEEILRLVAEGLSNKEVALKLDLQVKTVKHYMTAILQKLHVRNRTEAAVMAKQHWR